MSALSALNGSLINSTLSSLANSSGADSTLTGLNASGIQFTGRASGLDTNKIIQGLLAVDQVGITRLQDSQSQIVKEQTAFKTLQAKLLDLQSQADRLAGTFNGAFDARTVSSS